MLVDGIVGARPNMMKMAALARALSADGTFDLRLIHTGQHYDARMSDVFFRELGLPEPAINLHVGSGSQGAQTARVLTEYEKVLLEGPRPRGVLVVGDVTSTMACTLAAAKLQIPVAHVEAGLRSGDRTMPEEINRIVTDALAEVLLVSDPDGIAHLAREGHAPDRIHFVGNVMIDTLYRELPHAERSDVLDRLGVTPGSFVYLTLHRPSNVDDPAVLGRLLATLGELSREVPFVFAAHPRTLARIREFGLPLPEAPGFRVAEPLGYRDNLRAMQSAFAVLTDSGGIQEETSVLKVPCLTLRDTTERPVTVSLGSSELVGNDPERIKAAWQCLREGKWKRAAAIPLWDGHAAERCATQLVRSWG
jgi:UDP-N-acetylglucosamine 2-epimerase (non-hydrolysing)